MQHKIAECGLRKPNRVRRYVERFAMISFSFSGNNAPSASVLRILDLME